MAVLWRGTSEFTLAACLFLFLSSLIPLYLLTKEYGWDTALSTVSLLALFAYLIEMLGVATGFPYGSFRYLDGLGPLVSGVPWMLPFAWVPLILGVTQIMLRLTSNSASRVLGIAWVLVALDLVLDPGAVALSLWKYDAGGVYFSVPWTNFIGWIISGSLGGWLSLRCLSEPKASLTYWSVPLVSAMGFWSMVCLRAGFNTPSILGVFLAAGLISLVIRDEKARIC